MRKEFLVFGSPCIEDSEILEVVKVLKSGWLGTGPRVARFEKDFLNYKQSNFAIAVNSCTAALHLSLIASGVGAGDEVITTALTFCATINAILHAGAKPVLADIDPVTMNIDPVRVEEKITENTKALLLVHFAGRPCDMENLCRIAKKHNLKIIEDCAHAIESEYRGKKVGSLGDFGCFSFYVTKNIVTGEGGMVLTKNEEDAARIKMLALHGMTKDAWKRFSDRGYKHYYVTECGFKYNMMDIQAAIGIHQLQRVEQYWQRRRHHWQRYSEAFADMPIVIPAAAPEDTRHAYHLYTILVDKDIVGISRDEFLEEMTARNIGVGVHYLSIPEHPYYQQVCGYDLKDYPHAAQVGRQTLSLPLSAKLNDDDLDDVISAVKDIVVSRSVVQRRGV
ncbi:MAG: DegT/DnrJ/EryC1/StrS family aminotransferase [Omnitrophica bacterium]|nr:DegT/DnrJ/EryC1/StrS family aminotransferase [Candidatus Omnitrophota bacterium]